MNRVKHFLSIADFSRMEIMSLISRAIYIKSDYYRDQARSIFEDKVLGMIFEKPSTRTRVSFEVAAKQLGGSAIVLNAGEIHLGKSESFKDTALVLSRYLDAIMIRCYKEADMLEYAKHSTIPVINGLTDSSHPCQALAGAMTFTQKFKDLKHKNLCWVGDFSNVLRSYIHLAPLLEYNLVISTPTVDEKMLAAFQKKCTGCVIKHEKNPEIAVKGADVIITDSWVSMGQDGKDISVFSPYQVNKKLMSLTGNPKTIFSHCLPAHRGIEVTDEVMDSAASVVFDEAENRLHIQKAIIEYLMGQNPL